MPRGRDQFTQFEGALAVAGILAGLLPRPLINTIFEYVRPLPGRLGLAIRYVLLRKIAKSSGRVIAIFEGVYILNAGELVLGDHISVHPMCYLDAAGSLSIGSDVSIAHGVTIMTTEHDYALTGIRMRDAPVKPAPVVIGNDVWIGAGVKILAGVTVGDHVVVGAGAVVTRDIPSHSLAVGVPARVTKTLDH